MQRGYQVDIDFPKDVLRGYDPNKCKYLGLSYRLMKAQRVLQQFYASSAVFDIAKHPQLWASLELQE